jgi:Lon protease-like protein
MADELFVAPLFPLNMVLFPGMALPLHIFEPRYKQMTEDCLADHAPFGIMHCATDGAGVRNGTTKIGTFARIADYEQLPDGCYNLLAMGTHRFEVAELRSGKPYLTGLVRPVRDTEESDSAARPLLHDAREALRTYLRLVMTLIGGEERHIEIPDDARELSYLIGMCLTDDDEKQRLLEITSLVERLRRGRAILRDEAQALTRQLQGGVLHPKPDRSMLN